MLCYKCYNQMNKYIINNVLIDKCNVCGSIWLDKLQFENILYESSKKTINELQKELYFQKIHQKKIVFYNLCPKCSIQKLQKFNYNGISVDKCYHCKGIFFEYKKLNKILEIQKNKPLLIRFFNKLKHKLFNFFDIN